MKRAAVVVCTALCAAAAPPAAQPPAIARSQPWFTQLGLRSIEVQAGLSVLNQVVLVPDAATYLDEVSRWSLQARWPVLIEDTAFAPRFVRAFKPAAVYRRASVLTAGGAAVSPPQGDELKARIEAAVVHAWNGKPGDSIPTSLQKLRMVPAGIVGASVADPAWTAAVALAAGRGQLLAWIDGDYGSVGAVLGQQSFAGLDSAVTASFKSSGLPWDAIGDALETFTLCRSTPLRVTLKDPAGGWNTRLPPRDDAPLATCDALCRNADGKRYAFAAQIPGDSMRATYMAMCSLFLSRTSFWLFDGYAGRTEAMFAEFGYSKVASLLKEQSWSMTLAEGSNASASAWRTNLPVGIDADVVMVNSAGNSDFFQIGLHDNMWSTQVPVLNRPAALSMVHSFSLQMVDSPDNIGWRWLEHGVYAYVGSVQEPFLVAFVPPRIMLQRALQLAPFLVASRQWDNDLIPQPWRVATLGDPLMTIVPAQLAQQFGSRLAATPVTPDSGYTDVRVTARESMEATRDGTDAAAFAAAMRALVVLGDDKIAAQLWGIALAKKQGAAVAADALGPLFRMHNREGFTAAWALAASPTAEERDMLWGMWSGQAAALSDRSAVAVLKRAVRAPRADMDAELLVNSVRRAEGKDAAVQWLNDLIAAEPSPYGKRKLAELQNKL